MSLPSTRPLRLTRLAMIASLMFSSQSLVMMAIYLVASPGFARGSLPHTVVLVGICALAPLVGGSTIGAYAYWRINQHTWSDAEGDEVFRWLCLPWFRRIRRSLFLIWLAWVLLCTVEYAFKLKTFNSVCSMLTASIFLGEFGRSANALKKKFQPPPLIPEVSGGWAGKLGGVYSDHWGGKGPTATTD